MQVSKGRKENKESKEVLRRKLNKVNDVVWSFAKAKGSRDKLGIFFFG